MRFDTPIYFQKIESGSYNANTGNYETDTISEERRDASVNDTGAATLQLIYGGFKQGSLTIRLQTPYNKPFDRIRIGSGDHAKFYTVDRARGLRTKQTFIVSEVKPNA